MGEAKSIESITKVNPENMGIDVHKGRKNPNQKIVSRARENEIFMFSGGFCSTFVHTKVEVN